MRRRNYSARPNSSRAKPRQLEHAEQREVCKWLRAAKIKHAAIPNAGKRSPRIAAMLKAEGMQPSFPDLLIFTRPPSCPGNVGVAIEMKRVGGPKPTEGQEEWLASLAAEGWVTMACFGAADALQALRRLGYAVPG